MSEEKNNTSYTLIQRALDLKDERAWEELYKRYNSFICYILLEIGVGNTDVDDLAQQIYLKLTDKLKTFNKEKGLFRSWLKTVVRNAALNYFKKQNTALRLSEKYKVEHNIHEEVTNDDIDGWVISEWQNYLMNLACKRIEEGYSGGGLSVFKLSLEGKSAPEISELLDLPLHTVYTLKKRTKKRIIREVRALSAELELY